MDESVQEHLKPGLDSEGRILMRAADYIEKHGWCRGSMQNAEGQVCAQGAIAAGATGDPLHISHSGLAARERLVRYLNRDGLWAWNDVEVSTQEEVVRAFRSAALCG